MAKRSRPKRPATGWLHVTGGMVETIELPPEIEALDPKRKTPARGRALEDAELRAALDRMRAEMLAAPAASDLERVRLHVAVRCNGAAAVLYASSETPRRRELARRLIVTSLAMLEAIEAGRAALAAELSSNVESWALLLMGSTTYGKQSKGGRERSKRFADRDDRWKSRAIELRAAHPKWSINSITRKILSEGLSEEPKPKLQPEESKPSPKPKLPNLKAAAERISELLGEETAGSAKHSRN
jgi:hypothetical protein